MSYWKLQKNICFLKGSQIANALANAVVAKVEIINNHAATITSLVTLVAELTTTNKVDKPACGGVGLIVELFSMAKD